MNPSTLGVFFAVAAAVPATHAQSRAVEGPALQARREAGLAVQYTPDVLAVYRQQLDTVWMLQLEIASRLGERHMQDVCRRNRLRLAEVTDEQLSLWKSTGVAFEGLIDALLDVELSLAKPGTGGPAATPGLPGAAYSGPCGSERPATADLQAALIAIQVAEGVWTAASRACDEVIVAAGFGGNTSLLCIAADEALFLAQAIFDNLLFCIDDIDSAEIEGAYERLGHIHGDIEGAKAGIDSLGSAAAALQSSLNAHDANIDGDLAAFRTSITSDLADHDANIDGDLVLHDGRLVLHDQNLTMRADQIDMQLATLLEAVQDASTLNVRMQIERNLSQPGSLQTNRIVLFELPAAQGGELETVRDIVQESMSAVMASGLPLHALASYWFGLGEAAYAAGQWKTAYDHFRLAYQATSL